MRNPFRRRRALDDDVSRTYGDVWYPAPQALALRRDRGPVADQRRSVALSSATETRAIAEVPWEQGGPPHRSASQERALSLVPVFAAVRLLADTVSTLPIHAMRRIGDSREPMGNLPQLFALLADDGRLIDWLHRCMTSLTLRGNAYGLITARDGFGFPIRVDWLDPSEVHCDELNSVRPIWYWRGRRIDERDFVHIPWFTLAGKVRGLAPIEAYALTVDTGLKSQQYGTDWFDAGGVPPGTFKNSEQTVDQEEAEVIKGRLVAAIRARKPIVYGRDWDYNPITIPPEEAQFVETMQMTATQIASIYGIPPEMIGGKAADSLTYATEEMNQIRFVTFTLRPWLVKLEHAFSALLPERQYVRFNGDALIRADVKARHQVYEIDRRIGLRNIDEIRALEDLPPLPDGQGQDYTPLRVQAATDQPPAGEKEEEQQ